MTKDEWALLATLVATVLLTPLYVWASYMTLPANPYDDNGGSDEG